jgi:hypothetical protein
MLYYNDPIYTLLVFFLVRFEGSLFVPVASPVDKCDCGVCVWVSWHVRLPKVHSGLD